MKKLSFNKQLISILLLSLLFNIHKCGMTDMAGSMAGGMASGMPGVTKEEEVPEKEENPQKLSVLRTTMETNTMMNDIDTTISEIKDKMHNIEVSINGRLNEIEKTGNHIIFLILKSTPRAQSRITK
jgi:hypothetical protein